MVVISKKEHDNKRLPRSHSKSLLHQLSVQKEKIENQKVAMTLTQTANRLLNKNIITFQISHESGI